MGGGGVQGGVRASITAGSSSKLLHRLTTINRRHILLSSTSLIIHQSNHHQRQYHSTSLLMRHLHQSNNYLMSSSSSTNIRIINSGAILWNSHQHRAFSLWPSSSTQKSDISSVTNAADSSNMSTNPVLEKAASTTTSSVSALATSPAFPTTTATTTTTTSTLDPSLSADFAASLNTTLSPTLDAASSAIQNPAILEAITRSGDLKSLGLCHYTPVGLVEYLLELIYVNSGLPWWGTIMILTLLFRILLFPAVVRAQRAGAIMANLKPVLQPLQDEMAAAQKVGDTPRIQAAVRNMSKVYKQAGVSPFSGLWALAQAPVFMSMFFALRAMAELPVPGFENGGILWFSDLTVADPYYLLPFVAGTTMIAVMEFGMAASANTAQGQTMKTVARVMTVVFIPIMATMPAALFVYWVTSNFFTLLQFFFLRNKTARTYFNIPPVAKHAQIAAAAAPTGMAVVSPLSYATSLKMVKEARERTKIATKLTGN